MRRTVNRVVERKPSAGQPAHHGPHGYAQNIGCLMVGKALHAYQGYQHAMLQRELVQSPQHLGEREPVIDDRTPVAAHQIISRMDIDGAASRPLRTLPVEPEILRNAKHPTVEASAGLPLISVRQSTGAGLLYEVVSLIRIPSQ
jgi:hypothetical protein